MKATGIICAVLFTSAITHAAKEDNWTLTKSKDGISSYVGTTGANGITPTRVEMTVPASTEKVVRVIANMDEYDKWVPYCKKSYTIQQVSDTCSYGYQRISAPMVADRDIAVRLTVRKIGNKDYEILVTAVPNFIKSESGAIRIQHMIARYHVYAGANNLTHIEQVNEVDIGGRIPAFMLNWANKNQPQETFLNLRNQILHR
jgi:hypothetical protein